MSVQLALREWVAGRSLSSEAAESVMLELFSGDVHDGLVGGLLAALAAKGVTGEELAGMASAMRAKSERLSQVPEGTIDTCGTGGGITTFNLSTGAAIVAAGAGINVAKHGNRGVTSACGSADVLEALGVRLISDVASLQAVLAKTGLTFMFAQHHHPAMRHVIGVRKALGIRTVFNLLGPLTNPAGAKRQMIGLFDPGHSAQVAQALALLGVEHAMVVHAREGLDEVSPCGRTDVTEVKGGEIRTFSLAPSDFGLDPLPFAALQSDGDIGANALVLREALTDPDSPRCLALLPNAACALWLGGAASSWTEGAELARQTVAEGKAAAKLADFAAATHEVAG